MQLGDRLKAVRLSDGISLATLSARAGVSKSMLSRVERNDASPTITTLQKIADALDVDIARLIGGGEAGGAETQKGAGRSPVSVVRAGQRKKLVLPWGATYDMLTPDLQREIEFILITYPVNGGSGDLYSHEGEECGFVVEGRFKGIVGDQEFVLEAGDSIYYSSSVPHRWENAGDVDAKAVWAITPPSFLNGKISD